MNRRNFLKSSAAAALAQSLPWSARAEAGWRSFETVTRVDVVDAFGVSRAWVPLARPEDSEWQRTFDHSWTGNPTRAGIYRDPKYGAAMLYAEWSERVFSPVIEVASRVVTRDRAVDLSFSDGEKDLSEAERRFYTAPTELVPTDGIVLETALEVTKGARTEIEKTRAIYDWIVEHTFRDPKTRGCGVGDVKSLLESGNLGGKCADLNALFVGLSRAVGVPARDVYGVRVAPSNYGYQSLGAGSADITRAQHCRAEFFARGYGWVPVDPADVRKVVLEEPPGNLPLGDRRVAAARRRLFGSWEMNWVAYNMGNDIALPGSNGPKLPFLMYVNAQAGGEMRDQLEPQSVSYKITVREITA
jgi:transglutaminase-like putative cysteine protease